MWTTCCLRWQTSYLVACSTRRSAFYMLTSRGRYNTSIVRAATDSRNSLQKPTLHGQNANRNAFYASSAIVCIKSRLRQPSDTKHAFCTRRASLIGCNTPSAPIRDRNNATWQRSANQPASYTGDVSSFSIVDWPKSSTHPPSLSSHQPDTIEIL